MSPNFDDSRAPLLSRRVPASEIVSGRAYVIHARNGGVGVAIREDGHLGYRLHREKFDHHFLFVEWDWDEGAPHGTAIPMRLLPETPPGDDAHLLDWLAEQQVRHHDEIQANWAAVFRAMGMRSP